MATTDDVDCLSTLCHALKEVIADPNGLTSDSEEQVRELFALLPQVFATDTHAGRTAQLLHACHPLHVVSQFLSTRWLCPPSVRICSMRSLMEVATGAAVLADHTGRLKSIVGEHLREASAAAYLLHIVMTTHSVPEASTASEVLFVLAMTIPSAREDLRLIDGGIAKLCARALQRPNAPQVQSYLAGIVRLLAEHAADLLSADDVHFIPMVFSALASFDPIDPSKPLQSTSSFYGCCTSRRAAVLFLESAYEVLSAFPSAYTGAIHRRDVDHYHIMEPARSVVDVLQTFLLPRDAIRANPPSSSPKRLQAVHYQSNEATPEDCTEAAWSLYRLILSIEGRTSGRNSASVVFSVLSDVDLWREVITSSVSVPASRPMLCLLREAVCSALSLETQRPLVTACLESLPVLCSMLVPERSNALCMKEAAIIVGVLLAKSPAARRELRRLVSGYESWAESLCARIHQLLRAAMVLSAASATDAQSTPGHPASSSSSLCSPAEPFEPRRLLLVDAYQTILNDGDQAQHVDMLREERVAQALLHEQRRRFVNSSSPSPLDVTFIDTFLDSTAVINHQHQHEGGVLSARARELCCRLALVLMIEATNLALTDEGAVEDSADDLVGAVGLSQPALATTSNGGSTPRGSGTMQRRTGTPGQSSAAAARRVTASPSSSRGTPPPHNSVGLHASNHRGSASRYQEWVDTHLGRPKARTLGSVFGTVDARSPFRPSGASQKPPGTPLGSKASSFNVSGAAAGGRGATSGSASLLKDNMHGKSILEVVKEAPLASDEYLSMAIMMHLPIRYGPHYNRGAKAAVRKVNSPNGVFVQPIRRNNSQTWSASDVQVGELHVIFVPFHKLSCRAVEEEIMAVDKHLVELSKRLVTTPNAQRTRRWFLQDMVHDVLPKTELLLRDLLDLLYKFGVDDVVYQLSLVRVADEGRRQTGGAFAAAVDIADTAMPNEILRLSTGAFRDILHSGNILFAVQELRTHYFDSHGVPTVRAHNGHGGYNEGGGQGSAAGLQWSSLTEVDKEIRELEQKLAAQQPQQVSHMADLSPQRYVDPVGLHDATSKDLMSQYRQGMVAASDDDMLHPSFAPPPTSWTAAADVADMYSRADDHN